MIDRFWFHSVYFREPSGVLFELATMGPGFTADEPLDSLGESLSLPPSFEPQRQEIERTLTPLPNPRGSSSARQESTRPWPARLGLPHISFLF